MNVELRNVAPIGPFEFRWPDAIEHFDDGWEGIALKDGQSWPFRHGVGRRDVYGRSRVHTVTWLNHQPMVEGVEADDYAQSRCLISQIKKPDKKMAQSLGEVPAGYEAFSIVTHRDEISARYSRNGLAVKIREDDAASWVLLAIFRARDYASNRGSVILTPRHVVQTVSPRGYGPLGDDAKAAVVKALLAFQASSPINPADRQPVLTPDPEANAFVLSDDFAFLLAVILDQGIPYERAWGAPLKLKQRLGHLDPARIARSFDAVHASVQQPPALHRYINSVPMWIVLAAQRVLEVYEGDASAIWNDEPTAAELQRRLQGFQGIGQKKSAMAVEILARDRNIPIREMRGSDVAVDIHVRRVFLRTGLAERDDPLHMIEMARVLWPQRPGELDLPAWRIGGGWCHPTGPACPTCPITASCPKLLDRAIGVTGV